MKVKVSSSDLVSMLKIATKVFEARDDSSFVYLKVDGERLHVVSRCQSAFFSGSVEVTNVEIEENEANIYYVDGDVLKRLSGIFPAVPTKLEFEVNKDSRVFVIKYTGNKFKLQIVRDTQEVPKPKIAPLGMVQGTEFMTVLNSLLKIVDNNPDAQEHPSSCLHLVFSKDKMKSMATDRFALAELTKEFSGDDSLEDEELFLLKHPQASLLSKVSGPAEVLQLVSSPEYFGYIDGNGNLALVGRTDLDPLQYQPIKDMASNAENSIVLEIADLKDALSTISKLSAVNDSIIITVDKDEQTCKTSSIAGDEIIIPVRDVNIDESITVNFTRSVLQEALIPVDTDDARLEWGSSDARIYRLVPINNGVDEEGIFIGVVPNVE